MRNVLEFKEREGEREGEREMCHARTKYICHEGKFGRFFMLFSPPTRLCDSQRLSVCLLAKDPKKFN